MRRIICAAALICFMHALNASAVFSASYGDIDIAVDHPVGHERSHGYASYSVQVQNRSPNKTRRVKISIEPDANPSNFYEEGRLKSLTKTIKVAPNATAHTYIRQPYLNLNGRPLKAAVWIDGQKQTKPLRLPGFSTIRSYSYTTKKPAVTFNKKELAVAIDGVQKMRLPPYTRSAGMMQRRDLETNALIYGSLDGILLTLDEAEALSGAEREAVWDYVKSGGSLAVMGEGKLPDEWLILDARLENGIPKSGAMERYEIGFGLLLLAPPPPHKGSVRYQLYDSWKKTQQPWNATYSASGANAVLPVEEPYDAQASYRRMFILMLILAVLIGPVNIFLLKRIDRRMKLYWTVPAVSLLACVLVVFYAAIADGGKRMRVCSLTYLDQGARSAFTIGWVGFYSPSAHPDGLLFDEETELALQAGPEISSSIKVSGAGFKPGERIMVMLGGPPPKSGVGVTSSSGTFKVQFKPTAPTSGPPPKPAPGTTPPSDPFSVSVTFSAPMSGPTTKPAPGATPPPGGFVGFSPVIPIPSLHAVGSIDWTNGQRWSGEWIKPRIPLHFKFRKIQERTERIDLKRDGGKLKAVNRLGADVKAFWYADHEGKLYRASDIRNGAEAVLTETKGVQIGGKTLRQLYISQDWVPEIEAAKASPAAYLQPGRYIAELEENVFVEKAMKGAKMRPSTFLVVGDSTPE